MTPFGATTRWRACPMPSAKMVAQKPAGNFSPLSFCGQDAAALCAAAGALCAEAEALIAHQAASVSVGNHRLYRCGRYMDLASEACGMHRACANGTIRPAKSSKGDREFNVARVTVEICLMGVRFG